MIKTAYTRKNHNASMFTGVKRTVTTIAAIAAIAYVGARTDFDLTIDGILNGERQPAKGYASVSLERKVNPEGKVEFYLNYELNGKKNEIPVYSGANGPQAGTIDYVLANIDFKKMTAGQAAEYARNAISQLEPAQKAEYVLKETDFSSMTKAQAAEYARKAWELLEPAQKYGIVKAELEKVLK